MPYKDPEDRRRNQRAYRAIHREERNAKARAKRAAEPKKPAKSRREQNIKTGARLRARTIEKLKRADDLLAWGYDIQFILDDVEMTPSGLSGSARRYGFSELAYYAGREYERTRVRKPGYEAARSARRRQQRKAA